MKSGIRSSQRAPTALSMLRCVRLCAGATSIDLRHEELSVKFARVSRAVPETAITTPMLHCASFRAGARGRILVCDRNLSNSSNLETILVNFQRPNLRFQRGPRDAQLGRSPLGSEYPAATFFQGGLNHFLLLRQESSGKLHLVFRFCQSRLLW